MARVHPPRAMTCFKGDAETVTKVKAITIRLWTSYMRTVTLMPHLGVLSMRRFLCIGFVLLISSPLVSQSDNTESTGNDLLPKCNSAVRLMNDRNAQGVSTFDVGYCIGIISGVNDLLAGLHQIDNPDGSTKGQYIRV